MPFDGDGPVLGMCGAVGRAPGVGLTTSLENDPASDRGVGANCASGPPSELAGEVAIPSASSSCVKPWEGDNGGDSMKASRLF